MANATATDKKRLITWAPDYTALTLKATVSIGVVDGKEVTESHVWDLKEFTPNMDWKKATDLERGIVYNGLKQRLADKAAVGKDAEYTAKERLDMMVTLGEKLLESGTYALPGAGGGGLTAEANWEKAYKGALKAMMDNGIPEAQAQSIAAVAASNQHPKAKQAVMLADLAEYRAEGTTAERRAELSAKYPAVPQFTPATEMVPATPAAVKPTQSEKKAARKAAKK